MISFSTSERVNDPTFGVGGGGDSIILLVAGLYIMVILSISWRVNHETVY